MNTVVDTEPERKRRAKHSLLNSDGNVVEDFEEATGVRYQDIATGKTIDYHPKGDAQRMLALFGARTLATNEASAVNQKGDGGAEQVAAIQERFDLLDKGQWVDRTREGGPRIDQAVLSDVVLDVMIAAGKIAAEDRDARKQALLAKWAADPKLVSQAHSVPQVRDEYAKRQNKTTRTVDDLAGMLA